MIETSNRISVAPMMDWTDRHCRFFHRLMTHRTRLFTEMVTARAILRGDRRRLLDFDAAEHPLVLQLGGSDPGELAEAAAIAHNWGYDEINLNCGCPSDRVSHAKFGACLMAEPKLVGACVAAMMQAQPAPVSVKCRIGIDDTDSYDDLYRFVATVADAGCTTFTVHARKAWLQGLSPKQNREIPPLRHGEVHRLKRERPELTIVINGGIRSLGAAEAQLRHVDGVMIGRAAYEEPWLLAEADSRLFGAPDPAASRHAVAGMMADYAEMHVAEGVKLSGITRHMLGLFQGLPGARAWRRLLSTEAPKPGATADLIRQAAALVTPDDVSNAA